MTILATGFWLLVRTEGVDGDMAFQLAPRWRSTAEQRLLSAHDAVIRKTSPTDQEEVLSSVWSGMRGARRDGVVRESIEVDSDWQNEPPRELWRRSVGPGWSSFSFAGSLLFTQEQRGEEEVVVAYRVSDGEPVWVHADRARFWEALAGAGPRATPTFSSGVVYTLGATGWLNALEAATGDSIWQRNVANDTSAEIPEWGFSSSPLVVEDLVVVHTGGVDGQAVIAYESSSGEPRWTAAAGALSYSSVQRSIVDDVEQLLLATNDGLHAFDPLSGQILWEHSWPVLGGARVVQPLLSDDGGILLGTSFGMGTRRLDVRRGPAGWEARDVWTSPRLKPYYNDSVVHKGHVYGFDARILACLDVRTGERRWKGGRYGNGQLLLLPDDDLLVVVSDRGLVALVRATPGGFEEVGSFQAIQGKTWNHPAIVDGVLYVRNGEEMAAFALQ